MQLNTDEQSNLTHLVPPLPNLVDEGFSEGVLVRTRLIRWRRDAMHVLAWFCLALSFLAIVPWQAAISGIQHVITTMLLQSVEQFEQFALLANDLQSNLHQLIDFNQPIILVTALLIFFAVMLFGVFAED